jgi:hypothetical protein
MAGKLPKFQVFVGENGGVYAELVCIFETLDD